MRGAMGRELKRLSVNYLSHTSSDYKTLLSEIQPPSVGILGFEQDLPHIVEMKKRKKQNAVPTDVSDQQSESSDITVPLSPVESHRQMDLDDEVMTQRRGELIANEDVIPTRRTPVTPPPRRL